MKTRLLALFLFLLGGVNLYAGQTTIAGSSWTATNTNGATAGSSGASAPENNAIKAGTTVEKQHGQTFPNGTATVTMQGILQAACSKDQANLSAATQPATYYGDFYDGVGWGAQ